MLLFIYADVRSVDCNDAYTYAYIYVYIFIFIYIFPPGLFAPQGSNTFNSQTFQGLTVSGTKGDLHVFIGHRWGALNPPFPNASDIWLPLTFSDGGGGGGSLNGGFEALQELEWQSAWDLDTEGAVHV